MTNEPHNPLLESRLVPVMREGVEIVKMLLFRALKADLLTRSPERPADWPARLAGAVVNELFGTPNQAEPFAGFAREHAADIERELAGLAARHGELRIPLTDGLRMQFLCDSLAGDDDPALLERARHLGILLEEREMPLPHHFINLVRRLGAAFHLVTPPAESEKTVN